ncbi:MAG: 2-amino-4-hydroxy-6-hydroxymethyldihydropteridine diphosphokinase [Thermacetogeniaceae bacterium]
MSGEGKGWNQAFIGLGSNMGDRLGYLEAAIREMDLQPEIRVIRASSVYESEPVGYRDQSWFLNQVVEVETSLGPWQLLHALQGIENRLGRKRLFRWGPRVIDLDLLLYGGLVLEEEELTIPHPRMYERNFVLFPLNEIAPGLVHPDGLTTAEHLERYLATSPAEKIRLLT